MNYLLLLDTDKIKDYVFASSKLKEMRGASMLLEYLNFKKSTDIIEDYFKQQNRIEDTNELYQVLYLDGGSGKVLFKYEEDAINCGKEIEEMYRRWTLTASITWAVIKVDQNESFHFIVSKGESLLRKKKQQGKSIGHSPFIGVVHRCTHTGTELVEDMSLISYEVLNASKTFKQLKKEENSEFPRVSPSSIIKRTFYDNEKKNPPNYSIRNQIAELYGSDAFAWPSQLSVIGRADKNGDIGLLYFDGNSMNKVLTMLKNPEEYIQFSQKLRSAIIKSLLETIKEIFPVDHLPVLDNGDEDRNDKNMEKVLPLEIILHAGDDIIAVVPSTDAIEFTTKFMSKFSDYTKNIVDDFSECLTMSGGIAFSKSSFPIKYLVPIAEQLLKSAKKKNYELVYQGETDPNKLSTFDYLVVTMSTNPNVEAIRSEQYYKIIDRSEYYLTMRPFNLEQWDKISEVISHLKYSDKPFPNSKMKDFYHLHFMDEWEGNYYYSKYITNLTKQQREAIKKLYAIFKDSEVHHSPWFENKSKKYSPLIDVFEVYRYV